MLKSTQQNAVYTSDIFTQEAAQGDWAEYTPKLTTQIESLFVLDSSTQNELHTEKEVVDGEELIVHDGTSFKVGNATGVSYDTELTPPKDINNATYTGNSEDLTTTPGEAINPSLTYDGIFEERGYTNGLQNVSMSHDGSRLLVIHDSTRIDQYNLATPWDITTLSANPDSFIDVSGRLASGCTGAFFSKDGSKFYYSGDRLIQFSTPAPFEITNSTSNLEYDFEADDYGIPSAFDALFNEDGTKIILVSYLGVTTYDLLSPYDLRTRYNYDRSWTVSGDSSTTIVSYDWNLAWPVDISPDGKRYFKRHDAGQELLFQYNMKTPYDVLNYEEEGAVNPPEITAIFYAKFNGDGTKILLIGEDGSNAADSIRIKQYSLVKPYIISSEQPTIKSANFKTLRTI